MDAPDDKTRASYEDWKQLDNQLECFLNEALRLAGMRHVLMHYADGGPLIPAATAADALQGVEELLADFEGDLFPSIRQKLKAYRRASGLTGKGRK